MILFISDLHLQAGEPDTTRAFLDFLNGPARKAQALWILGDLFEFWVGDDDLSDPFHARIADALADLTRSGVALHLIAGNRDFLLGQTFARRTGARLETEPVLLEAWGMRMVLVHGDAECIADQAYQRYRRRIRAPFTLAVLRALPLAARRAIARRIRRSSEGARRYDASRPFIDLDAEAIAHLLREQDASVLIHGHTHRPACHELQVDGRRCTRWVLPDWHGKAQWLEAGPQGLIARQGD